MRILYATDGSEGAAAAGRLLARLALGPQDAILLLRVDYPEEEEFFGKPAEALPRNPRAQRYLRRLGAFERAREALHGTTARIETQVRVGAPAEQILACAREWSADLVVVGAMGQSAAPRYFVGSVAERVLRHAVCDVLLARPVRHGLERVLVAVDGSAVAVRVVARAALLPLPPQTEVRLTQVLPPLETVVSIAPMVWASLSAELQAVLRQAEREAEERLRQHARVLAAADRRVSAEILHGDPATALTAAAESERVDLVILGSHGEGGVDRFLLGSVSERVARHAGCSALVVR